MDCLAENAGLRMCIKKSLRAAMDWNAPLNSNIEALALIVMGFGDGPLEELGLFFFFFNSSNFILFLNFT